MERRETKLITSAGSAYNLELGFVPSYVHTRNITQWKQTSQNTELFWDDSMADATYYGYATQSSVTDGMKAISDTSNGFTPYDTSVRASRTKLITGISKAISGLAIVTVGAGHGYTAAANDGDTVAFNFIPSDSMHELSGMRAAITYINATTFYIDIDTTGFSTYDGTTTRGGTVQNITTAQEDTGFKGITLGTIIMANSADKILVEATWLDNGIGAVSA